MGVTVTFIAVLELMREGLIDIVQAEPFAPLHVRLAAENRMLRLVANNDRPDADSEVGPEGVFEVEAPVADTQAGLEAEPVATSDVQPDGVFEAETSASAELPSDDDTDPEGHS
jgi:segregation and condensation protein A